MPLLHGFFKSTSKEIDILRHDVAIFKNLIKERQHPFDLVRELISNAAATQVGASRIDIGYTKDKEGHIFEVSDNGCGMDFSGDQTQVGRLARFLGLGLSGIVGEKADEFSWKGLGSKLAYQSRRVVIETRAQGSPLYEVRINEPWDTLNRNVIPRPRITEHNDTEYPTGTRIKVLGHPPHRQERPFTTDEIRRFLLHRTFVGFTRQRISPPRVTLSVLGQSEKLEFGFPEFRGIAFPDGLQSDAAGKTLLVNVSMTGNGGMQVRLKGFLTWDPAAHGLSEENLNVGLILSSRGIPFFELPMAPCGARRIASGNPGRSKVCLVAECDQVFSEMNISRSALVDSAVTVEFREMLGRLFEHVEGSVEYRQFRALPASRRRESEAAMLVEDRGRIESDEQNWVVLERSGSAPVVLMREPRNETEAVAILWKLESLGALPFAKFQTMAHPGANRGPDLLVRFQEDGAAGGGPPGVSLFEAENRFCSWRRRAADVEQAPNVICWDIPGRGRRVRLNKTDKKFKFTLDAESGAVPVYVMRLMDGIAVLSTRQLRERGIAL